MNKAKGVVLVLMMATVTTVPAFEIGDVDVHGYVSQGFITSTDNNYIEDSQDGTFDFREYGINGIWGITDRLTLGGQLAGREFGSVGNDVLFIDWLQVDYQWRDWLGFRIGQMKVPYGFYNETRDVDSLRTEIFLPQAVYMEYFREPQNALIGAGIFGYRSCGSWGGLQYAALYGQQIMDPDNGDMSRLMSSSGTVVDEFENELLGAVSLIWETPVENLRIGGTYSRGEFEMDGVVVSPMGTLPFDAELEEQSLAVGSIEYGVGDAILAAEYLEGSFAAVFNYTVPGVPATDLDQDFRGYYVKGTHGVGDRMNWGLGYGRFDMEQTRTVGAAIGGGTDDYLEDAFLSTRFDLPGGVLIKLEQHWLQGGASAFNSENPDGESKHWTMTAVKMSYLF